MLGELTVEDRRNRVAELVAEEGFMSLAALALRFSVSESTLRRDLEALDEQGILKRAHGGAIHIKSTRPQPLGFA